MKSKAVKKSISLPIKQLEMIKNYANEVGGNPSSVIQMAISNFFDNNKKPSDSPFPINSIAQEFVPHKLPDIEKWSETHNVDQQEFAVDLINSLCRYIKRNEGNGQPRPLFEPKPKEIDEPVEVSEQTINYLKELGVIPKDFILSNAKNSTKNL